MYLRKNTILKYALAALAGAALYSEWLVYVIQPWYWRRLECQTCNGSCVKILFVADPQIQGEEAVPLPLSLLFNWDSDRYLQSTFTVVMDNFKPDIIVFMGDLMDEGSISTTEQYIRYVSRLSDIFNLSFGVTVDNVISEREKLVWLPGDNDIGGENEPIRKDKIEQFEKYFDQQPGMVTYHNVSIYKVNGITNKIPMLPKGDESNFKIVVSHYPTTVRTVFGQKVVDKIRPNILFCAHDHVSKYIKQNNNLTHRKVFPYDYGSEVLDISFDNKALYEIYVPTCSCRMGTSKIGYGAAILENNNQQMRYTVFWSPGRFSHLFLYVAIIFFITLYCVILYGAKLFYRRQKMSAFRDTQPLISRI